MQTYFPELIIINDVQLSQQQHISPVFQSNENGENKALWMAPIESYAGHCHLVTKVRSFILATHPAYSGVITVPFKRNGLAIPPGTAVSHQQQWKSMKGRHQLFTGRARNICN